MKKIAHRNFMSLPVSAWGCDTLFMNDAGTAPTKAFTSLVEDVQDQLRHARAKGHIGITRATATRSDIDHVHHWRLMREEGEGGFFPAEYEAFCAALTRKMIGAAIVASRGAVQGEGEDRESRHEAALTFITAFDTILNTGTMECPAIEPALQRFDDADWIWSMDKWKLSLFLRDTGTGEKTEVAGLAELEAVLFRKKNKKV